METRCHACNSHSPGLHPAVQHEGEVEFCRNHFHLSLPWHYQEGSDKYTHIVRAGDAFVLQLDQDSSGKAEATARFIVRAVNAHEGLVAALKKISAHGDDDHPCNHTNIEWCRKHIELVARAALAAATPPAP